MFPWAKSIHELLSEVLNTKVGRAASDVAGMFGKAGRVFVLRGIKGCTMATYSGQPGWVEEESGCCHSSHWRGECSCGLGAHWTWAVYMLSISSRQERSRLPAFVPQAIKQLRFSNPGSPETPIPAFPPSLKQSLLHLFPHLFLLLHQLWSQASELNYSGLSTAWLWSAVSGSSLLHAQLILPLVEWATKPGS